MKILNKKQKKTSNVAIGTLYDVNKSLVEKNVSILTKEEMKNKKDLVKDFIIKTNDNYYMLLCNDRKDYTIFRRTNPDCEDSPGCCLIDILIDECLVNRGQTKSIELTKEEDAIEIWLSIDDESYCYYFFPYGLAVIEC